MYTLKDNNWHQMIINKNLNLKVIKLNLSFSSNIYLLIIILKVFNRYSLLNIGNSQYNGKV